MSNKFTKLNIGDSVASSGGRVWKKLSAMPTSNLITFTIDGTTYQAEEGVYWEDWVDSQYNTDGFTCNGENSSVYDSTGDKYVVESSRHVEGGFAIIDGYEYGLEAEITSENLTIKVWDNSSLVGDLSFVIPQGAIAWSDLNGVYDTSNRYYINTTRFSLPIICRFGDSAWGDHYGYVASTLNGSPDYAGDQFNLDSVYYADVNVNTGGGSN